MSRSRYEKGTEQHVSHNQVSQQALDIAYDDSVEEPDWDQLLDDDLDKKVARERWRHIVSEVKVSGHVNSFVAHQMKMLVLFHVLFEISSRHIFSEGAVKKARRSKMPQYNPWFSVMKDASTMINAAERKLGITQEKRKGDGQKPSTAKGRKPRAADAYLTRPHRLKGAQAN